MDHVMQEIMARLIGFLVILGPAIILDFWFFKGRYTRQLFGLFGDAIEGIIGLFFRLIGAGLRAFFQGIWRGIRGQRRKQQPPTRRVEHHHYYHGRPGDEAGGEDDDEEDDGQH